MMYYLHVIALSNCYQMAKCNHNETKAMLYVNPYDQKQ